MRPGRGRCGCTRLRAARPARGSVDRRLTDGRVSATGTGANSADTDRFGLGDVRLRCRAHASGRRRAPTSVPPPLDVAWAQPARVPSDRRERRIVPAHLGRSVLCARRSNGSRGVALRQRPMWVGLRRSRRFARDRELHRTRLRRRRARQRRRADRLRSFRRAGALAAPDRANRVVTARRERPRLRRSWSGRVYASRPPTVRLAGVQTGGKVKGSAASQRGGSTSAPTTATCLASTPNRPAHLACVHPDLDSAPPVVSTRHRRSTTTASTSAPPTGRSTRTVPKPGSFGGRMRLVATCMRPLPCGASWSSSARTTSASMPLMRPLALSGGRSTPTGRSGGSVRRRRRRLLLDICAPDVYALTARTERSCGRGQTVSLADRHRRAVDVPDRSRAPVRPRQVAPIPWLHRVHGAVVRTGIDRRAMSALSAGISRSTSRRGACRR